MPIGNKKEIVTSLRVDPELWKEARKAAIDCDITLGELIDQALRDWIAKQENCEK
jgi:predicted HicB family RNase H-like nuclease